MANTNNITYRWSMIRRSDGEKLTTFETNKGMRFIKQTRKNQMTWEPAGTVLLTKLKKIKSK